MIAPVFYPIFNDAHNWDTAYKVDPWRGFGDIPAKIKLSCEQIASKEIDRYSTYFGLRKRGSFFNLQGRSWNEVTETEKLAMGEQRGHSHSKKHESSFAENKEILREYVHFLHMNEIVPIVVLPPFTAVYNRNINSDMKEAIIELVDSVPEDIHYVDFNQCDLFDDTCFMDTDHLNERGAHMMCEILAEIFGR